MEKKVSIVIPNYNGSEILLKNLPEVEKNCAGCEIIIVDDASTDDSVDLIKKNFPKVKLIVNPSNQGFAKTVNRGVNEARGQLVLLLNSDVAPKSGFLKTAVDNFKNQTDNLFGVGLADLSHEGSKVVMRGRGGAKFHKGFLTHFAKEPKSGETLWISGGSSLIDKEKFEELNGFDQIYAPFYWEDIDLSYRARKLGYFCLFEENSKVDHFHEEGAIKKTKSPFFIKTVAYKNQFIFVWKNISDYFLIIEHFLWLPYHFIKAIISFDLPFFLGFMWAVTKIPQLIFNYPQAAKNFKLTDREVIEKFEGQ